MAQAILTGNIGSLRTNDVLRKDEWEHYDSAILDVARMRLNGVADLFNAGLTYSLPNPLGKTMIEWERVGDMTDADVTMSGLTDTDNDRVTFDLQQLPVPIIHKDFRLNIRALAASREKGEPLDTMQVRLATQLVAEKAERDPVRGARGQLRPSLIPLARWVHDF